MRKILLPVLFAAAGTVVVASPAHAVPAKPDCKTAVTRLVDRPDSGVGGTWALDTITRTVTICEQPAVEVKADVRVDVAIALRSTYKVTVTDVGTFTTVAGKSPAGGKTLKAGVRGHLKGGFTATFTADAGFKNYLGVFAGNRYHGAQPSTTGDWIVGLWGGADIKIGANLVGWSWTYWTCTREMPTGRVAVAAAIADGRLWVNASTGNRGDITGCVCPSPGTSPSASLSASPSTSASASASASSSASASASASVSVSPSPGGVGGGVVPSSSEPAGTIVIPAEPVAQQQDSLPVTGASIGWLLVLAAGLLLTGTGLAVIARRRRAEFTA